MENDVFIVSCDIRELAFLASLLDANSIFGINNPFSGLSNEDIKSEWPKAQESLINKQFIQMAEDGGIIIDEVIAAIVKTCAFANHCIVVNHTAEDQSTDFHNFYITEALAVEVKVHSGSDTICEMIAYPTVKQIYNQIIGILTSNKKGLPAAKGGKILESSLEQVKSLLSISQLDKGVSIMKEAGFIEEESLFIAKALEKPVSSDMFLFLTFEDGNAGDANGFVLLEGDNHLWILFSVFEEDQALIEFHPYDIKDIEDDVKNIIGDLSAIYLSGAKEMDE
ncbi:MAG: hypothetical protein N2645_24135 [Clostridia bacterium]|nr:hypothetical protein [Clostridia bacterium]